MRKTWPFRVWPLLTHRYHLLSPCHWHARHERAHSFPLSSTSLLLSLLSSLHKISGPTSALANTHQTAPCPAEIDGCVKQPVLSSQYPVAMGSFCKVLWSSHSGDLRQTSGKVSILFYLVSGAQQALSKCSLKWNENTVQWGILRSSTSKTLSAP